MAARKPAARKPATLVGVAAGGDRRKTLEGLRAVLAAAIEDRPAPRDLPPLVSRLQSVMAELEALPKADRKGSPVDDIAARRQRRRAAG